MESDFQNRLKIALSTSSIPHEGKVKSSGILDLYIGLLDAGDISGFV